MTRVLYISIMGLCLCLSTLSAAPVWESPIEIVEWVKQQDTAPESPDELEVIVHLLDNRESIQTPSGIPTTPSNEARKFLSQHLSSVEKQLPESFTLLSTYGQTRLLSILGNGSEPETLLFLKEQLNHSSSSIRSTALDALVSRHEQSPLPLRSWFSEGWQMKSPEAMKLPGRILDLDALQQLLDTYALYQKDPARAASSFWSLTTLVEHYPEDAKTLFAEIDNFTQKATLAKAITQTEKAEPEEFLISLFENDSNFLVLASAIDGLKLYQTDPLKKHLLEALFVSLSREVTQASASLLGRSGDPKMIIPLAYRALTLSEAEQEFMAQAFITLGKPASDLLCQRLREPNYIIIQSSLNALKRMGITASDSMYEALMWPELDFDIRVHLQFLTERTGRPAPTDEQQVFFRLLTGTEYATEHLMRPWLSLLQEWTDYPVAQIRIASYEALGFFRDSVSTDLLVDALTNPDITLANVAAKGLESRIFSLSSRLKTKMEQASIAEAKIMSDALALIEFVPHRAKERALFEATRERWQRLNRFSPPAQDGILEAFVKATQPQQIVSLAWAVHHLDPGTTPAKLTGTFPGLPQLLPWSETEDKTKALENLDNYPPLQRRKAIALAACMGDAEINTLLWESLRETSDFPFELLIRLHESDRQPLVDFAYTALNERNYADLSLLAEAMKTTSELTARAMAERLEVEMYSPQSFEEALLYHDLLGNWPQLIAMGEQGIEKVKKNVLNHRGMEAIDRYIALAGVEGKHPVKYLADVTAARPQALFRDLFNFYDQQPVNFTPLLYEQLMKSSDGASFILAQLLLGLGYKTEDPQELVLLGYALNNPVVVGNHQDIGLNFLLEELMGDDPNLISRASTWALKHRTFTEGRTRITRSINTKEDIETLLQDENALIVLSSLSMMPTLHKQSTNDFQIVDLLIPMLDSERIIPTQQGTVPLNVKIAETLVLIGEDAAAPLLDLWLDAPESVNSATYLALLSLSSPTLVGMQKTILRNRQMINDEGLVATINTLSKVKDPSTATILFEIALEELYEIRRAAMNALIELGEPAIPVVIKSLDIGEPASDQRVAASILADIGGETVEKEFIQLLKSNQTNLRKQAVNYLVETRSSEAMPLFINLLNSPYVSPSLAGSQALVEWGIEAVPYILKDFYNGSERTQKLKISTLRRITGKNFGEDLSSWRSWYNSVQATPGI